MIIIIMRKFEIIIIIIAIIVKFRRIKFEQYINYWATIAKRNFI